MYVYTVRFTSHASFHDAFSILQGSVYMLDCIAESENLELRFRAVPPHAERLVERIYQRGGLGWCQRHRLRSFEGLRAVRPQTRELSISPRGES